MITAPILFPAYCETMYFIEETHASFSTHLLYSVMPTFVWVWKSFISHFHSNRSVTQPHGDDCKSMLSTSNGLIFLYVIRRTWGLTAMFLNIFDVHEAIMSHTVFGEYCGSLIVLLHGFSVREANEGISFNVGYFS